MQYIYKPTNHETKQPTSNLVLQKLIILLSTLPTSNQGHQSGWLEFHLSSGSRSRGPLDLVPSFDQDSVLPLLRRVREYPGQRGGPISAMEGFRSIEGVHVTGSSIAQPNNVLNNRLQLLLYFVIVFLDLPLVEIARYIQLYTISILRSLR